ncbi:MAG: dephospho-CoA kinase [Planctomycetes bacterium RBG_16_64_10]|nr:MAG: dephospho-CoA kinase [Planctomycetes bacterium RBG_16_64_10]
MVVGVVGGIASGKTLVAAELARLGASVWDADGAGHAVLRQEDVRHAVVARWGSAVLGRDGQIDRQAVARIVFAPPPSGPTELEFLEQWTHPRIELLLRRQLARLARRGVQVAVLDAAVMIEAGWDRLCGKIVFVDTPRATRLARCRQRGWTEQEFARREAAQEILEMKRARADLMIDNSGSVESTRCQIERFWRAVVPSA